MPAMGLDYYDVKEKCWLSPRLVLVYYDEILKKHGDKLFTSRDFKKVLEAKAVAIALLGIHKYTKGHFMMQVPKDVNSSPDIVTMNLKESEDKPVHMQLQDVEVVEYSKHSEEDIGSFLINTKLSPTIAKKAYDDKTIILCNITKNKVPVDHGNLFNEISTISPKPAVYLLGPILDKNKHYRLARVWPGLDGPIEIDIVGEGNKYPKPDSCKFSLGSSKKIIFDKSSIPLPTTSEVFELREGL